MLKPSFEYELSGKVRDSATVPSPASRCRIQMSQYCEKKVKPAYRVRKIVIVGVNYEPEHAGIAPYTTAAAEYLAGQGHIVLVLTGVPHYPSWAPPPGYGSRLRKTERRGDNLSLRRLRHYVPAKQSALRRAAYELTFGAQVLYQRPPWRPDVVIAVVPSLMGAVAASRMAWKTGAPLAIWMQDVMSQAAAESGMTGATLARVVRLLERWLFQRATGAIVISEAFAKHIDALCGGLPSIRLIRNWTRYPGSPDTGGNDMVDLRRSLGWPADTVVAIHAGNMGLKQSLERIVVAARRAQATQSPVRFVLLGDGSQRQRLKEMARGCSHLAFVDPVPEEKLMSTLAAANVLLVCEADTVTDMSLPSKLTTYFAAARPVVAVVRDEGSTAAEIRRSDAGIVLSQPSDSDLLQAVLDVTSDAALSASLSTAGRQYASAHLDQTRSLERIEDFIQDLCRDH